MDTLQLFTKALEEATGQSFISAVTYQPLLLPAYKEFTFILRKLDGSIVYEEKYKEKVTNDNEKAAALEKCTEKFITVVLKDLMKHQL